MRQSTLWCVCRLLLNWRSWLKLVRGALLVSRALLSDWRGWGLLFAEVVLLVLCTNAFQRGNFVLGLVELFFAAVCAVVVIGIAALPIVSYIASKRALSFMGLLPGRDL